MSNTLLTFPEELKEIALMLDQLPDVAQVRMWPVLKDSIKGFSGENSMSIIVMVQRTGVPDKYVQIATFVPVEIWSDRNKHLSVVANIVRKIEDYKKNSSSIETITPE